MAKVVVKKARGQFVDEKYLGPEPEITEASSSMDLLRAYNWFNYFYQADDAKEFTLSYLKSISYKKDIIKKIQQVESFRLLNIGWNARILTVGGVLPADIKSRMFEKIDALAAKITIIEEQTEEVKGLSVQDRVRIRASDLISEIEGEIDAFLNDHKNIFDVAKWFRDHDVKPQVAAKIAEHYKPLYAELFDAVQGNDPQLKEAYSSWKKTHLRSYMEMIKSIISSAEGQVPAIKVSRKPRKKKAKPVSAVVAKIKYKAEDTDLGIKSIKPTSIVGSSQLWVYNTKYRTLTVYNAMGPSGLSMKGTTITGFDEKLSLTKKLRAPQSQIKALMGSGKVALRKFMDGIKCKANKATGRINSDVILLRNAT